MKKHQYKFIFNLLIFKLKYSEKTHGYDMNTKSILITWYPKIDQIIGEVKAIHFFLTDEGDGESILDIRTDNEDDNNLFQLAHTANIQLILCAKQTINISHHILPQDVLVFMNVIGWILKIHNMTHLDIMWDK